MHLISDIIVALSRTIRVKLGKCSTTKYYFCKFGTWVELFYHYMVLVLTLV